METMLHEHQARQTSARTAPAWGNIPVAVVNGFSPPPPSMSSISKSEAPKRLPAPPQRPPSSEQPQVPQRELLHPKESTEDQPPTPGHSRRDAGVSDAIWNQLQADIKAQEETRRKAAEEERRLEQELQEAEKQAELARTADLERAKAMEKANRQRANLNQKREIERQLKDVRRRAAERKAEAEKAAIALKKKQEEEAEKKRKELEVQHKLQHMGLCPMGYKWVRQGDGYRCTGGSHFISHGNLAQ
ncbi:hypothetical protein PAXINDRAFT_101943 [Paxillus involutus ATCC 200175]|uniref:Uncharacterized protein n=1 Tax=Paxillus involutus ATCC 200175 TaxID=664439 RepID=A0A0C9SRU5_PAXIN|nr:hypothetical protein PAXINDRAFT_101943 [Paxillus involutus ATCC 200175]